MYCNILLQNFQDINADFCRIGYALSRNKYDLYPIASIFDS